MLCGESLQREPKMVKRKKVASGNKWELHSVHSPKGDRLQFTLHLGDGCDQFIITQGEEIKKEYKENGKD